MPPQVTYILGLDLGQRQDPSALAVLEQSRPAPDSEATYDVRELRRWPLGTPYPQIVAEVIQLAATPPLVGCSLAIDGTGCGSAVVDLFRCSTITASVYPVLITAGQAVKQDEMGHWHIAKIQLVSVMQVLMGKRRWRIARKLPQTPTLERELSTFSAKVTAAGNETFQADWREGTHDDLVLAAAIAAWIGENVAIGAFTVPRDPGARSVLEDVPEGVFGADFMRPRRSDERERDGGRDLDISWPWP